MNVYLYMTYIHVGTRYLRIVSSRLALFLIVDRSSSIDAVVLSCYCPSPSSYTCTGTLSVHPTRWFEITTEWKPCKRVRARGGGA